MRPFIYYSPDFSIPSFAFMLMMASLVATLTAYFAAPKRGLSQVAALDLGILGTIGAVVGGRLFHVFVEEFPYYVQHPSHIYQIWRGGFVSYGGFIGLGVSWITYLKLRHLDTLRYLDHVALFTAPFVDFFVRAGCLMAGCCYGKPSPFHTLPGILYIVFNNKSGDAGSQFPGVPLYPTQIWSMAASVIIFLILYFVVDKRKTYKGQVMMSFLMMYALCRFSIEFLRGDTARGVYMHNTISTGQIMSLLFFCGAFIISRILKRKYPIYSDLPPTQQFPPVTSPT